MTDDQFEGMDSNEDLISREGDFAKVYEIAGSHDDRPLVMVNLNKYMDGEYPNGVLYKSYMHALDALLECVGGKIRWRTPVYGQLKGAQPLDEILCIWYPSHKSFLALRDQRKVSEDNFRLRNEVVEHASIYRCPEEGIPSPSEKQTNRGSQEILSEFLAKGFEIDDDHASLGMVYTDQTDINETL